MVSKRKASKEATTTARPLQLMFFSRAYLKTTLNPDNWKGHKPAQLEAIRDSVDRNSWAKACLLNNHTGRLINGHGRVMMEGSDDEIIPCLTGSWSEEDERYILATLDPITQQAEVGYEKLEALMRAVMPGTDNAPALQAMLESLCERHAIELEERFHEQPVGADGVSSMVTGNVEESSSRVIQLFYNEQEYQDFTTLIDELRNAWNPSDRSVAGILLEAARRAENEPTTA